MTKADRLHVAVDARIADPPGMEQTGLGRYAIEITRALSTARPDWRLTVFSNRPDLMLTDGHAERRHTRWPTGSPHGRATWLHVGSALSAVGDLPDVWFGPTFVLPLWWRGPAVVTVQDLIFLLLRDRYAGRANAFYATRATRFAVRRAAQVICPSEETRDALVAEWATNPGKIALVPNGVSEVFYSGAGAPKTNGAQGEDLPYVLFVGVFEARKGLETIEAALRELNSERVRVRLVLAGRPGWGTEEVLRSLDARGDVDVVLSPSDGDLARLYYQALALVYPSQMEGFGLPVAEALASGCPVIASNLQCIREFAQDAPLYLKAGDTAQLVKHIETLLGEPEPDTEARRRKGRVMVRHLKWAAVGNLVAEAIEKATFWSRR